MKKKITAVALVVALLAIALIGGTMAYFTDTKEATNTFTVGNVEIALLEQQRNEDGGLEAFTNNKVLMPIAGSVQAAESDANGLPIIENYVDKMIDVENTGKSDAYVRVLFAFPADMDDAQSAAEMMLHWNHNPNGYNWTDKDEQTQVTIDGREYNIYSKTYNDILKADETTSSHALLGVYLDSRVDGQYDDKKTEDITDDTVTYSMVNGRGETVSATYPADGGPEIHVYAQAIQAAGFGSAAEAFAASDLSINPWATPEA